MTDEAKRPMADESVYLREIDAGTDNACWVVCNKVDKGAVLFVPLDQILYANQAPASEAVARLVEAALVFAKTNPAFRSRPVGADGSIVREQQHDKMKAEDALYDALAPFLPKENNIHD